VHQVVAPYALHTDTDTPTHAQNAHDRSRLPAVPGAHTSPQHASPYGISPSKLANGFSPAKYSSPNRGPPPPQPLASNQYSPSEPHSLHARQYHDMHSYNNSYYAQQEHMRPPQGGVPIRSSVHTNQPQLSPGFGRSPPGYVNGRAMMMPVPGNGYDDEPRRGFARRDVPPQTLLPMLF
jgi:hypothetical protein